MVSMAFLRSVLPKPLHKNEIIIRNQTTGDIISEILLADALFADQYKLIAKYFVGADDYETAKNIWQFLKKNIRYVVESDENQTSCSPTELLYKAKGDCKHYSLFVAGILRALGIPHVFRFASYNILKKEPGHVYVAVNATSGYDEIIIDAVLNQFDTEKTYIYKTDKKPKKMLTRISGFPNQNPNQRFRNRVTLVAKPVNKQVARYQYRPRNIVSHDIYGFDNAQIGSIFGRAFKFVGNKVANVAKGVAKGVTTGVKAVVQAEKYVGGRVLNAAKVAGKAVLKVAAIPVRNAFLLVVRFNLLGLGVSLFKGAQSNPTRVREWWQNLNGNWDALKNAINAGAKNKMNGQQLAGIGFAPAAALALATPLIIAVKELLKALGVGNSEVDAAADKGYTDLKNQAANAGSGGGGYDTSNYSGGSGGFSAGASDKDAYRDFNQDYTADQTPDAVKTNAPAPETDNTVPMLLLVGGSFVLIAANKKRK